MTYKSVTIRREIDADQLRVIANALCITDEQAICWVLERFIPGYNEIGEDHHFRVVEINHEDAVEDTGVVIKISYEGDCWVAYQLAAFHWPNHLAKGVEEAEEILIDQAESDVVRYLEHPEYLCSKSQGDYVTIPKSEAKVLTEEARKAPSLQEPLRYRERNSRLQQYAERAAQYRSRSIKESPAGK